MQDVAGEGIMMLTMNWNSTDGTTISSTQLIYKIQIWTATGSKF